MAKEFERQKGINVFVNASSSGKLARQIELGARCDLFISASFRWMNYLKNKGILKSYVPLAKTKLVIVSSKRKRFNTANEICKAERVAIGDYRFAPFGEYALSALKNVGLYECIKDKIVLASHVAQAAVWVSTGDVDAAVIYFSDYMKFKNNLKLVWIFPDNSHKDIIFLASYFTGLGKQFLNFMRTKPYIFKRWGFELAH